MEFLAGFVQGITRVTISYPFDTVKTYMQQNLHTNNHTNTIQSIKYLLKTDPKVFYRGSTMSYLIIPFDRSIQYYLMEKNKDKYNPFLFSMCVGAISTSYNLPLLYITTNAVLTQKNNYTTIYDFVKNINIKKLYSGFNVEIPKMILATGSYMGTYMYLRENYNKENSLVKASLIGMISSFICWSIIFPLDTIRTSIQVENKTIIATIKYKYTNYGLRSFYKGITPVLIRTIPSSSLGMFAYELTRKLIN
jgi:hypothetical protein